MKRGNVQVCSQSFAMDKANLSKLTVAQLRNLCKEKGLSNYSKIPKAALLAKLGAGVVSDISGTPSFASSKATKDSEEGIRSTAEFISSDTPSMSTASSVLGSYNTPSLRTTETSQSCVESSTGPKLGCNSIQPPNLYQIPEAFITRNSIPAMAGSKRSSKIAFVTTPSVVNPVASKRQKISSRPGDLAEFKVPEAPIRANQVSSVKDLAICTSRHQSAIQPLNSEPSQTTPTTDPPHFKISLVTRNILAAPFQRNVSSHVTSLTKTEWR